MLAIRASHVRCCHCQGYFAIVRLCSCSRLFSSSVDTVSRVNYSALLILSFRYLTPIANVNTGILIFLHCCRGSAHEYIPFIPKKQLCYHRPSLQSSWMQMKVILKNYVLMRIVGCMSQLGTGISDSHFTLYQATAVVNVTTTYPLPSLSRPFPLWDSGKVSRGLQSVEQRHHQEWTFLY